METFVKLGFTALIFVIGSYLVFKYETDEFSKTNKGRPPFISAVVLFSSSIVLLGSIIGVIWKA